MARAKHFRLHGILQSTIAILNLGFILRIMLPIFRHQVLSSLSSSWKDSGFTVVALHSLTGSLAWLLAFYVVLVAGTPLVPRRLRFSNYRRWMWMALVLWWIAFGLGCAVSYRQYVNPPDRTAESTAQSQRVMQAE